MSKHGALSSSAPRAAVLTLCSLLALDACRDVGRAGGDRDAGDDGGPADLDDGGGDGDAGDDARIDGDPDPAEESAAARLTRYLAGTFDSGAQAAGDPRFHDVRLRACPLDAPDLGDRVLYVEQAMATSPGAPYRQRVYVIEALDPPASRARSVILEPLAPAGLVGLCDDPDRVTLTAEHVALLPGCEVPLEWRDGRFSGATVGERCANDYGGAAYATSEVEVDEEGLRSWDRGWDSQGRQVWGAVAGPYVFDRKTPLEPPEA